MSDDRPREKKSWRDIDAKRDRGGGAARSPSDANTQSKLADAQKSKQYRAALDALFEKGGFERVAKVLGRDLTPPGTVPAAPKHDEAPKVEAAKPEPAPEAPRANRILTPAAVPSLLTDEGRAVLRKKVLEAIGRDQITRALDRYLLKFPLPEEYDVLEQALEHSDGERVDAVLAKLESMVAKEKPRRARTLIGKLRYLEEMGESKELKRRASALRSKLG